MKDVSGTGNFLNSRFVLELKSLVTKNEKLKAKVVTQGHPDWNKSYVIHDSTTLKHSSLQVILPYAAVTGFALWTQDVDQA